MTQVIVRFAGILHRRRRFRDQRIQPLPQRRQLRLGEAGADAADIVERAVLTIIAEMQRAEAGARPCGRGEAEHHEFLAAPALHLAPGPAAPGRVGRVRLLADDALQPHAAGMIEHGAGIAAEMVAEAQRARAVDEGRERGFAVQKAAGAAIPPVQMQEIEQVVEQRAVGPIRQRLLQQSETRNPVLPQRDQLAVEHGFLGRDACDLGGDAGQPVRPIVAVAGQQPHARAAPDREQAVAVELHLAEPARRIRRQGIGEARELRLRIVGQEGRNRSLRRGGGGGGLGRRAALAGGGIGAGARLRGRAGRGERGFAFHPGGVEARLLERIMFLDEQPVLGAVFRPGLEPDQHEFAVQPRTVEQEFQFALVERRLRIARKLRRPGAAIPCLDRAGAVIALRYDALEIGVVERVILGPDREPLVGRIAGRAFRHRPAPQHAAIFEAEIPVQAPRCMLLHDEDRRGGTGRPGRGGGFRSRGKVPLRLVGPDGGVARNRFATGHCRATPERARRLPYWLAQTIRCIQLTSVRSNV